MVSLLQQQFQLILWWYSSCSIIKFQLGPKLSYLYHGESFAKSPPTTSKNCKIYHAWDITSHHIWRTIIKRQLLNGYSTLFASMSIDWISSYDMFTHPVKFDFLEALFDWSPEGRVPKEWEQVKPLCKHQMQHVKFWLRTLQNNMSVLKSWKSCVRKNW